VFKPGGRLRVSNILPVQGFGMDGTLTRRVVFPLQFDYHYVINITRTTKYKGKEFARNN
jgi:hypothetical protein